MCGIAAVCGRSMPALDTIQRMVATIRHRGPDAQTYKALDGCHLGHARLSIIDLDGGSQPMADATGRRWIVFNGEIYNYRELRDALVKEGYEFRTQSDTEVILAAFACWGRVCLDRFRGMFAFAIWDTATRTLFAARDIFGEKPLYYARQGDRLLLASELKSFTAVHAISRELSYAAVDGYLALGYVPPDRTIYEEAHTLPPGHCLEWNDGSLTVQRYWLPTIRPTKIDTEEAAEELRRLLRQAVRRQMVADVPVGAFLSGGHDSSTVVALMRELRAGPLQTFSVGFGEHVNELPFARRVAEQYGTEHHELDLANPPVGQLLERMAEVYDEPFMDPSHVPTYVLSQFARERVKVALTGDGADELFGGYAWYPLMALSDNVPASTVVWIVLRATSRILADRHDALSAYSRAMGMAVRWPDAWRRYIRYRQVFADNDRRELESNDAVDPTSFPGDYFRPEKHVTGLQRALYFDLTAFLPGDILVKVDRAAMAHGLETRAPFLDRDVVEFALSLPADMKVTASRTKTLFKHALAPLWPEAIRSRPKQGFAGPLKPWLERSDVRGLQRRVFAHGSPLRRLLPGVNVRRAQSSPGAIWCLLTLGLWLERHRHSNETEEAVVERLTMAGRQ